MAFELVVETTKDSRTGKQSRRSWVEYCGTGSSGALTLQRSQSYRHQGTKNSLIRRAQSTSSRGTHGDGSSEMSRVHGLDAVSHYHVEVQSQTQQPGVNSNRRSRSSSNKVVDLVTVYPVEERLQSKSKSQKSKSKKSRRHNHHPISVPTSGSEDSMALIPLYKFPGQYPRIECAEPVEYQQLTYEHEHEHEHVNIVHAEPQQLAPPIHVSTDLYQSQIAAYEAPLVTTTGPGEDQHSPGTPKQRYFIDPNSTIPGAPILAARPRPGGPTSYSMYGAITNGSESPRPHSSGFYEQRRRYSFSGSAHGHSVSASAGYHSSGPHSSRRDSFYSTTSSSGTDSDNGIRHHRPVYIGTEHLRGENHRQHGVQLRYGREREHVIDVGLSHSKKERTAPLGNGGLKSRLKAATLASGMSKKRRGSSSGSRSSTTTSSSSSTSSTSTGSESGSSSG